MKHAPRTQTTPVRIVLLVAQSKFQNVQNNKENHSLYILIFTFLDTTWKKKYSGMNGTRHSMNLVIF
jgi:hypothetical protein